MVSEDIEPVVGTLAGEADLDDRMVRLCIAHADDFSVGVGSEAGKGNLLRGWESDSMAVGLALVGYRSRPRWRRFGPGVAQAAQESDA
jgi:hypothetical protein